LSARSCTSAKHASQPSTYNLPTAPGEREREKKREERKKEKRKKGKKVGKN